MWHILKIYILKYFVSYFSYFRVIYAQVSLLNITKNESSIVTFYNLLFSKMYQSLEIIQLVNSYWKLLIVFWQIDVLKNKEIYSLTNGSP